MVFRLWTFPLWHNPLLLKGNYYVLPIHEGIVPRKCCRSPSWLNHCEASIFRSEEAVPHKSVNNNLEACLAHHFACWILSGILRCSNDDSTIPPLPYHKKTVKSWKQWTGKTGCLLQMHRLRLRNNRLKIKTASGKLPIILEDFIEYTAI